MATLASPNSAAISKRRRPLTVISPEPFVLAVRRKQVAKSRCEVRRVAFMTESRPEPCVAGPGHPERKPFPATVECASGSPVSLLLRRNLLKLGNAPAQPLSTAQICPPGAACSSEASLRA